MPTRQLHVTRRSPPIVAGPPPNGSIIVFRPYPSQPDFLVVHRVRQVNIVNQTGKGYFFVTQGDNYVTNPGPDSWPGYPNGVPYSSVVGTYQYTIPIPYLGSAILGVRSFMYDDATGSPRPEGIFVIVILIIALFAFEVIEPSKKPKQDASSSEAKAEPAPAQASLSHIKRFPKRMH